MSNIGTVLREEISRLSRKEVRSQVDPTKKVTAQHRHDIAALKRQMTQLERQVTLLSRKSLGARPGISPDSAAKPMRFSAKGLQSQRSRLGLSAATSASYWGSAPRRSTTGSMRRRTRVVNSLGKLAVLRGIGKREAGERD